MATNVIYQYGNQAGPGPSYFQSFIGLRVAETTATQYRLERSHAIWVTAGSDFEGTIVNYGYWMNGSEIKNGRVQLYGSGWYADTGWVNLGWYSSGQSVSLGCWGGYTGSRDYNSNSDASYTVPQLIQAPYTPSACTLTRNSDTSGTMTWNFSTDGAHPVTKQQRALQTNGGNWAYTDIANGTTKSASISLATNNKYYAAIRTANGTGWSGWKYSNTIYTTPNAPTGITAFQNKDSVSVSASITSTSSATGPRYVDSYNWRRGSTNVFNNSTALSAHGASLTDTTTIDKPYYWVQVVAPNGLTSAWYGPVRASSTYKIMLNIPSGKSLKAVYFNVPSGTSRPKVLLNI